MTRGPGHVEKAILAIVDELEANPALAGVLQHHTMTVEAWAAGVYRLDIIERVTRAQYTATLRAMRALARRYPHRFVLEGGKGRSRLLFLVRPRMGANIMRPERDDKGGGHPFGRHSAWRQRAR
jgi:hypothetical protein